MIELGCRFGPGGGESQRYAPERSISIEMRFDFWRQVSDRCLITNFPLNLLEFVIFVKKFILSHSYTTGFIYSKCSKGAPEGSPSYDSATLLPYPVMINARELPFNQPGLSAIS